MAEQYVYGWYAYQDGTDREFRYPATKSRYLQEDGKKVTVEMTTGGDKWHKRRGIVVGGDGNYVVRPA
jgi:hypothetical protein